MNEKKTKKLYSWPIWADLPEELVVKISKCLEYSFQVGHFRAVCTSWRSAVPPPPHKRLSILPKYNPSKNPPDNCKYIRRLVFRLDLQQLPPSSSPSTNSYLIAVAEQFDGDGQSQLRLLNPITGSPIPISSSSSNLFPREINLNKFRVSVLHKSSLIFLADTNQYFIGKVVHLFALRQSSDGRNTRATATLRSGKLSLFNTGGKVRLNYLMESLLRDHNLNKPYYHDLVKYKEKWFAIDQYGRGVMVDSSLKVSLVTNPLFHPNRNGYFRIHRSYLVKSSGDADLFLVDRYLEKSSEQTNYAAATSDDDTKEPDYDMAVRFRVYKLEEEERCWKEVTSLKDQVIFVGDNASYWSYCVSAKDFPGCRGNFIYFIDQFRKAEDGDLHDFWDALKHEKDYSLGGFHMENAFIGPMACFPGYTDFFWPPPSWLS
ncbi:F-box protein SKIP23-like [Solanum dulcamara]|uniref:F-box protein SKIP23-like n=1 Tax=Solanum dulcamara TaxID=45834 RepID=UPI002486781A|nr:F-box protein SKIP23-like [Solanum dulcamara]XP_055805927.1 F-box protein SKIP23-like [Solanum dulcamara]